MIVPDLAELLALQATARSAGLRSLHPARAHLLGAHRGVQRGRGLEFEEVRPYVAGDDARSIDWRVSARRGRLHTKLFREERERPVWLLVDLQPGMFFASHTQLKSALAVRAAALLAWITALAGDRVGAVIANGAETVWLPPRAREAGVLRIFNALLALQPRAPAAPKPQTLQSALGMLVQVSSCDVRLVPAALGPPATESVSRLERTTAAHDFLFSAWKVESRVERRVAGESPRFPRSVISSMGVAWVKGPGL